MANKVYPPGAGDVTIQLGTKELVLKPSLEVALAVSRTAGGIRGAIEKVASMDIELILTIIRLGIGSKAAKRIPNLDQMVYENGLTDSQGALLGKLVDFLSNIARGGRPAEPVEEDAGDEDDDDDTEAKEKPDPLN